MGQKRKCLNPGISFAQHISVQSIMGCSFCYDVETQAHVGAIPTCKYMYMQKATHHFKELNISIIVRFTKLVPQSGPVTTDRVHCCCIKIECFHIILQHNLSVESRKKKRSKSYLQNKCQTCNITINRNRHIKRLLDYHIPWET